MSVHLHVTPAPFHCHSHNDAACLTAPAAEGAGTLSVGLLPARQVGSVHGGKSSYCVYQSGLFDAVSDCGLDDHVGDPQADDGYQCGSCGHEDQGAGQFDACGFGDCFGVGCVDAECVGSECAVSSAEPISGGVDDGRVVRRVIWFWFDFRALFYRAWRVCENGLSVLLALVGFRGNVSSHRESYQNNSKPLFHFGSSIQSSEHIGTATPEHRNASAWRSVADFLTLQYVGIVHRGSDGRLSSRLVKRSQLEDFIEERA